MSVSIDSYNFYGEFPVGIDPPAVKRMRKYVKKYNIPAEIDWNEYAEFFIFAHTIEYSVIRDIARSGKLKIGDITAFHDKQKNETYLQVRLADEF